MHVRELHKLLLLFNALKYNDVNIEVHLMAPNKKYRMHWHAVTEVLTTIEKARSQLGQNNDTILR